MKFDKQVDELCVNTIRFLACDAVENAKSGHPGMPMGAAAAAFTLWTRHLKHDPNDPFWPDRDRFILSAGHASMLLYALLYLCGYDMTLEDLKSFRQWGSKTPGHPEKCHPPGVEMTTGPLGQGFSHAVGLAAAEAHLAATFNKPDLPLVNHFTYVLASDGDLMEGVTLEACSLAGHLGLGKLIVLYDDNGVSLAGSTSLTFTDNIDLLFKSRNWQVIVVDDGNDIEAINEAISAAKKDLRHPSLIRVKTKIAFGSPHKEGSHEAHGAPLGEEEVQAAKKNLGWPEESSFFVPSAVIEYFNRLRKKWKDHHQKWLKTWHEYKERYPLEAQEFERRMKGILPPQWDRALSQMEQVNKPVSTRKVSESILQMIAPHVPELMGGSADLNPSCLTWLKGFGDFQRPDPHHRPISGEVGGGWNYGGRNIHFGVREHAMAAFVGGLALHGGIIPYAATFLAFADYMKPAIRLAALMRLPVIYVFTHDSFCIGEDGPTHQPVEQLMNLRSIPHLTVIRPADADETKEAWRAALLNREGPTALIFTRQEVPFLDRTIIASAEELHRGGYVLWDSSTLTPLVTIIATGSEVALALQVARKLAAESIRVRVVSLPSWEIFERQQTAYKKQVIPPTTKLRVAIEAGVSLGWERYVGLDGIIIGIDHFGASAPYRVLKEKFGFTEERVIEAIKGLLK
ncbi:MAG: transketolase [Syntrophales bacterium]|nr:transketolase [Syntrophales bacterium]